MTIPSTTRKAGPFTGTGAQTDWPFTFKIFEDTDIKVTVLDTDGEETVLTLGQYTVELNGDQDTSPGGTVVYLLPDEYKLAITGDLDYDQPLDLPAGGNFSPTTLENQLDRIAMQMQQIEEALERSAKVPVTEDSLDVEQFTAGILRLADSADAIDTLAPVASSIPAVAAVAADVTAVAGNADHIAAVAAVASYIPDVADAAADITTVADNLADVTNFSDVYYGPSATDPLTRRDGSALVAGDFYFNTDTDRLRVYDGVEWLEGEVTAATVTVQRFSGTGAQTAFTLPLDPVNENNTQVFISGVYQQKDTYSVSGTTLTFSSAPPLGTDNIEVSITSTMAVARLDRAAFKAEKHTATAGQTVFNLTTATYAVGGTNLSVFVNGLRLDVDDDYTETNSARVTMTTGLQAGDEVTFLCGRQISDAVAAENVSYALSAVRTVDDKLREHVSIKDFGAVGDGVTNDRAAINAAIAYVASIGGGTVFLPSGTYLVVGSNGTFADKYILLKSGVRLVGEGSGCTIFLRGSSWSILNTEKYDASYGYDAHKNIEITGVTFDGNTDEFNNPANLCYIESCNGLSVHDCVFKDVPGLHALDLNKVKNVRIFNNKFLGTKLALAIEFSGPTYYPEAVQLSYGDDNSSVYYAEDVQVYGNVFDKSATAGSDYFYTAFGNHTTDNTALAYMKDVSFRSNNVIGCTHSGVRACLCDGFRVENNTFTSVKSAFAIWTNLHPEYGNFNSKNIHFVGNKINGVDQSVVYASHYAYTASGEVQYVDNVICSGNEISGQSESSSASVFDIAFARNYVISGNIVSDKCYQFIDVENTESVVIENNVTNGHRLNFVYFSENEYTATGTGRTKNTVVSNNIVNGADFRAVHVSSATAGVSIKNNTFLDANAANGGREAVKCDTSCSNISITGNLISYASTAYTYGISVTTGTDVYISGNKIKTGSSGKIQSTSSSCFIVGEAVTATPEGAISATVGSTVTNINGSTSTTLYVKTSGTGNTGWTAK